MIYPIVPSCHNAPPLERHITLDIYFCFHTFWHFRFGGHFALAALREKHCFQTYSHILGAPGAFACVALPIRTNQYQSVHSPVHVMILPRRNHMHTALSTPGGGDSGQWQTLYSKGFALPADPTISNISQKRSLMFLVCFNAWIRKRIST